MGTYYTWRLLRFFGRIVIKKSDACVKGNKRGRKKKKDNGGRQRGGKTLVFTGISAAGCKTNIIAYSRFYWIAGALSCHKGHKMAVLFILGSRRISRNDVSEVFELRHYAAVMRLVYRYSTTTHLYLLLYCIHVYTRWQPRLLLLCTFPPAQREYSHYFLYVFIFPFFFFFCY